VDELRNHPFKQNLLESYIASHETELAKLLKGKPIQKKYGAFIPIKPANRLYSDQALVAGDAAGLTSALTGGGFIMPCFRGDGRLKQHIKRGRWKIHTLRIS
jgi:flavin-dependent dehydrogenase